MLKLFQREQSFISIFLFLLILSVVIFIVPPEESINTLPLLGQHIEIHWTPWFSKIATLLLVITIAVLMVRLNVVYNFIRKRTYLPAFFYVLLVLPIMKDMSLEPALYGMLGFLAILFTLFRSFKQKGIAYNYFYAGLLLGIISLLYAPALFYIVFIYIALSLLRTPNWREMVYPVIGVLTIYYLVWGIFYVSGISFSHATVYFSGLFGGLARFNWSVTEMVFLSVSGFLIVISSIHIASVIMGKKIYSRRIFLIFWWMFAIGLVLFILLPGVGKEIVFIAALPCSFLFSHYFSNVRPSLINEFLFLLFTVSSLTTIYM